MKWMVALFLLLGAAYLEYISAFVQDYQLALTLRMLGVTIGISVVGMLWVERGK
jgi:hypothetical protein